VPVHKNIVSKSTYTVLILIAYTLYSGKTNVMAAENHTDKLLKDSKCMMYMYF